MIYKSSYRDTGSPAQQTAVRTPGKSSGVGANIGGIVGSTIGQIAGVPLGDVETASPVGSMALGAVGGGIGGGVGETLDEILSGKQAFSKDSLNRAKNTLTKQPANNPAGILNMLSPVNSIVKAGKAGVEALGADPAKIARAAGSQAAYGAIPGGPEMKALPVVGRLASNIVGRTALRGAAGAGGSAVAQQIENGKVDLGQALATGGINAALPGVGKLVNAPIDAVRWAGKSMIKPAEETISRKLTQPVEQAQSLFGPRVVSTNTGKYGAATIHPRFRDLLDQQGQKLPSDGGDIQDFIDTVDKPGFFTKAAEMIRTQKDSLISPYKTEVKNVTKHFDDTLTDNFGTKSLNVKSAVPPEVKALAGRLKSTLRGSEVSLAQVNKLQQELEPMAKFGSHYEPTPKMDWARDTYKKLGELIDTTMEKANPEDLAHYKDIQADSQIRTAAHNHFNEVNNFHPEILNQALSKTKAMTGILGGERGQELAIRSIPLLAGGAANLSGLPPNVKKAIDVLGAAYFARSFMPYAYPEASMKFGKTISAEAPGAIKSGGKIVGKALQQLGVRLPSLGK